MLKWTEKNSQSYACYNSDFGIYKINYIDVTGKWLLRAPFGKTSSSYNPKDLIHISNEWENELRESNGKSLDK